MKVLINIGYVVVSKWCKTKIFLNTKFVSTGGCSNGVSVNRRNNLALALWNCQNFKEFEQCEVL